ncbi:PHP-associated domain-containing protein [Natronolimnohabitans sp. A-GB9]|uniref:PHP-associated domain-containing protein n=1 Tax=Natronolimnohabitans sp. A-GB9 TaxID=3069757 RepID=UPI0027B39F60|nr:PHP-associated domain-containing protein [Natronolimnohabitans sp. A-GB9]MDQ2049949.1 PHP-associated domain-containing protein [Natronolimnohabitans sp. A-GB9]
MFAVDLHAHTRFFHGRRSLGDRFDPYGFRLLAHAVDRRGLDGVATTNHDYSTRFSATDVTTIPGIEVSTTHGHVLVIGPDPPTETVPLEYTPAEVVELAHDRDCVAIAAHPYRDSEVTSDRFADVPFDAVEINGKHPRTKPLVEEIAAERDLPIVAGSDAHFPFEAGRAYTLVDAETLTPESVVDAIRAGRVEPRIETRPVDELLRDGYRRVHQRKHPDEMLARSATAIAHLAETRDCG